VELNNRGQAMLELLIVIPPFLLILLALVQLTELLVANMATQWAARQAARGAAVHVESADDVAFRIANRSLAPFLPPVPMPRSSPRSASALVQWSGRAMLYENVQTLSVRMPIRTDVRIRLAIEGEDIEEWPSDGDIAGGLSDARGVGDIVVSVQFNFPLRVPLAGHLFVNQSSPRRTRLITRSASFPVMYAP
jgi:hypothetical protein